MNIINEEYKEYNFKVFFDIFNSVDDDHVQDDGPRSGKDLNIKCDYTAYDAKLFKDCIGLDQYHPDYTFSRRFRVPRTVVLGTCSMLEGM